MAEEENTRIQTNGILLYWGMYVDKYVDDDEKEHYTRFLIDKVKQHMISIIIQSNEIASEFVWFVLANDMDFGIVCVNFINNMLEPNHRNKIVTEFNKHKAAYLNYKQDFDESISQVSQYTAVEQCSNTACTKLKEELKTLKECDDMGIILNFWNKYKYSTIILKKYIDAYKEALLYYFNKPMIDIEILVGVYNTHITYVPQEAKNMIQETIKIIIKGYLDDLIKKCSIISKNNILKRLQIDVIVQAASSIFDMGLLPHEYIKHDDISIFAKLFDDTVKNHNTLIELENNMENNKQIKALTNNESDFLNKFPKIDNINIFNEIQLDKMYILGKYYAQHVDIAKYQVTAKIEDGFSKFYYVLNPQLNNENPQQQQDKLNEKNSKRMPIYGLEMDDAHGKYMNIYDYAVIGPNEDNYLFINAMSNKVIFEIYRDDVQQIENCIYLPENTAPPQLDNNYHLKYIKPLNAYGKRSLLHGDILAFKYATHVDKPSKTVYQVHAKKPTQLYLRGNMFCNTTHALELINMYEKIGGNNTNEYKKCIDKTTETFLVYTTSGGGNNNYVTIAGRKRNIVIQKGKQYVRYNSELILLSKLEKMEAKETRAKEKVKIVKKRK